MNIAAMRVRVTFQKNTVIVDKYGNHKTGWADYFSCWATVGTSSGSESSGVVINHRGRPHLQHHLCESDGL